MKNSYLILLALLVALYLVWRFTTHVEGDRENTFDTGFPSINPERIDSLAIYAREEQGRRAVLYLRNDGKWRVKNNKTDAPVHEGRLDVLLNELYNLKPTRLTALPDDDWTGLNITDAEATRVIAYGDDRVLIDFMIGKFQYHDADNPGINRPPPGTINKRGITYVRLSDDDMVYSAEGFFGPNFNQVFGTWRNQLLVALDPADITNIHFYYADEHFTICAEGNEWYYENQRVNTQSRETYGALLLNKNYFYFADGFTPHREPLFRVVYEISDGELVQLEAFEAPSAQLIIRSSQNPETFFLDYDESLLDNYFPPLAFFFNPDVDYRSLVE